MPVEALCKRSFAMDDEQARTKEKSEAKRRQTQF
jgi:hypothetical protein